MALAESQAGAIGQKLNWLRAGVLGANDGIISTAGIVIGVATAGSDTSVILLSGLAGLVSGAVSMAGGEYASVSTQRDMERALIAEETISLREHPEEELEELADAYRQLGLSDRLAHDVARELTEKDALKAHAQVELGLDPNEFTNPWIAAAASFVSFAVGALLPLLAILLPGNTWRIPICMATVAIGLAITGYGAAKLGRANRPRSMVRNLIVGALTMAAGLFIGILIPTA